MVSYVTPRTTMHMILHLCGWLTKRKDDSPSTSLSVAIRFSLAIDHKFLG